MIAAFFFTWFFAASLWTVNALRRPVLPGHGIPPLWLPGMLVSELAPWYLIIRALIAWAFIAGGALEYGVGRAGFVLFILCEVGLVPLVVRTATSVRETGRRQSWLSLFKVERRLPAEIEKLVDVAYWEDLTLDAYRLPGTQRGPALVYIHPGSWMRGRPGRQALPLFYRLVRAGWVILDIRYPLSPVATFPDHLIGVKRALAWAREHGGDLGVDPAKIAIAGGSSGAHLAALAALTWDDPHLQPGFEESDTSVIACTPHYGIYDLLVRNGTRYDWPFVARYVMKATASDAPDLYRSGSPIDLVRPDAPPFLVVHGGFDSVVLAEESRQFADALQSSGASVTYHEVAGAQHGFDAIGSMRTRAVDWMVADFLQSAASG
jgi:acetyl esterase/lipase